MADVVAYLPVNPEALGLGGALVNLVIALRSVVDVRIQYEAQSRALLAEQLASTRPPDDAAVDYERIAQFMAGGDDGAYRPE